MYGNAQVLENCILISSKKSPTMAWRVYDSLALHSHTLLAFVLCWRK